MSDESSMAAGRLIEEFMEAVNTRNLDLIMSYMAEEPSYITSSGKGSHGTTYRGHEHVRAGVAAALESLPAGRYEDVHAFACRDHGAAEWTFRGVSTGGEPVEFRGCDLFRLQEGKIRIKDAYRKISG